MQGLWKAECPCHNSKWGTPEPDLTAFPLKLSQQVYKGPALQNWRDYYTLRMLSFDDPVAMILDAPLTLFWAIQQTQACLIKLTSHNQQSTVIYYLGAQKELDQWPVFLELLCLMPHQFTHIHFISPDVPSNLAGKCKAFRLQQINADTQCAKLEMTDSQDADLSLAYGDVGDDSSKQNWELPRHTLANLDVITVPTQCDVSSSADSDDITSGLQLSFHTGCYHDVAHELQHRSAPPDLVFGANAGLAAYPSWVPTLKLLSQQDAPPAMFTDFCEEAAVQAIRVMQAVARGPMQWIPISVNPFRKPVSCQGRDNNLPSYSNAFIFGMAPLDTSE